MDELRAGRDLDRAVARVLGDVQDTDGHWHSKDGTKWSHEDNGPRLYGSDYALTHILEDEIKRKGLQSAYIRALIDETRVTLEEAVRELWCVGTLDFWPLIYAAPAQCARAFLKAVGS